MLLIALAIGFADLLPPDPAFVRPPKTNHPYHITLTGWTGSNTSLYWGTNGLNQYWYSAPTGSVYTVSNLYPGNSYVFEVWSLNIWMINPPYWLATNPPPAPVFFTWPWPRTNFLHVFMGTNLVAVDTNPPSPSFYRARITGQTSNSFTAELQRSATLFKWASFPSLIVLTNKTANLILRLAVTNNIDPFVKPD